MQTHDLFAVSDRLVSSYSRLLRHLMLFSGVVHGTALRRATSLRDAPLTIFFSIDLP